MWTEVECGILIPRLASSRAYKKENMSVVQNATISQRMNPGRLLKPFRRLSQKLVKSFTSAHRPISFLHQFFLLPSMRRRLQYESTGGNLRGRRRVLIPSTLTSCILSCPTCPARSVPGPTICGLSKCVTGRESLNPARRKFPTNILWRRPSTDRR